MSRGLGKIERAILEELEDSPSGCFTLSRLVWQCEMMDRPMDLVMGARATYTPNYSSYKRAVRSLRAKGYVTTQSTPKKLIVCKRTPPRGTDTDHTGG